MKKIFTLIAVSALAGLGMQAASVSYDRQVRMPASAAPEISDEVIYDAPEGEIKWMNRTCDGFEVKAFDAIHGKVLGSVVQMVESEDGDVYLSHMASEYPVDTWTKFQKEGNTLVMNGIQAIYTEYDYDLEDMITIYLAPMKVEIDENNRGTFVVTDDSKFVFNIGEDGSLTAADPEMLLGVCVHTLNEDLEGNEVWIWKGFGDRDIKMVPADGTLVALPDGVEPEDWVWNDGVDNAFVQVAIDGDDFYINGMNRSLTESWIKGKISDGKVTFPSGQYLGADMEIYYYSYFCGAEFSDEENEDGEIIRVASLADSSVFTYDAEKKCISSENGYVINSTSDQLFPLYFYENIKVEKQNRNPEAAPAAPYDLEYFESDWGNSIWFQLPSVDVDGNLLNTNKLFYEIYVDGVLQEFTKYDDDWNEVVFSRIPYAYQDYDIYVEGEDHTVYIYTPVERNIAVRSVYVNENKEDIYSEVAYYGTVAVDGMYDQKTIVSEKWYDLQGRLLASPAAGVVVKVATYSDGTVKRSKVISVK